MWLMPTYIPEPTALRFHQSDSRHRVLLGPVGTGKSVACVIELLLMSAEIPPDAQGVRASRALVVRNTYSELLDTTIATWEDWVDTSVFPVMKSIPYRTRIKGTLSDGTRYDFHVVFRALEEEKDVRKLKSLDVTFVWGNEASELRHSAVVMCNQRSGRYPMKIRYEGCGYTDADLQHMLRGRMILDSNLFDAQHWMNKYCFLEKPPDVEVFQLPPALVEIPDPDAPEGVKATIYIPNPEAENVSHHSEGSAYWMKQVYGATRSWIQIYLMGKVARVVAGQTVLAESFDEELHASKVALAINRALPVLIGFDYGIHPAAVFAQPRSNGGLQVVGELAPEEDIGLERFIEELFIPYVRSRFVGIRTFTAWGDPAGRGRSGVDLRTPFNMLRPFVTTIEPTLTNKFATRKEAVEYYLMRREGMLIDAIHAPRLIEACAAKYVYKGREPAKDYWSHVSDAFQYLCLGYRSIGARRPRAAGKKVGVMA